MPALPSQRSAGTLPQPAQPCHAAFTASCVSLCMYVCVCVCVCVCVSFLRDDQKKPIIMNKIAQLCDRFSKSTWYRHNKCFDSKTHCMVPTV